MSGGAGPEPRFDDLVRVRIFERLAETGSAPSSAELARTLGWRRDEVREALFRLASRRAVVLDPESGEIWMAGPFSAVPTAFRVVAEGRAWWANCAWDSLGVPATLSISARVETRCGDCGEPLTFEVDAGRGPRGEGVVHLALPAARWYEDIGYT